MPKILVVCITSTEKLGSQLAMRDPENENVGLVVNWHGIQTFLTASQQ